MMTRCYRIQVAKVILLLILILNVFQGISFGGPVPILEYGYISDSSDATSATGGHFHLFVAGQQNKTFNGIVGQINGAPLPNPRQWAGAIWFNGTGPDAGESHVVVVERSVSSVGYYAVTSKVLTSSDIASPIGVSFVTANLIKMNAPTGSANSNAVNLNITHVTPNVNPNDVWGYRIHQSIDGGAYSAVTTINGVSTSDVSAAGAGNFSVSAFPNHNYRYKYKVLFRNREYISTNFSNISAEFQTPTANNYLQAPGTPMQFSAVSGNNMYIVSIPYDLQSIGFTTPNARNLMDRFNHIGQGGSNGQYVTQIMQFRPTDNAFNSYFFSQILEDLTGNGFGGYNFSLVPGEAYEIKVASAVTHNIAGSFPVTFNLSFINTTTNAQYVSLPYDLLGSGKIYENMEDLFKAVNNISSVVGIDVNDLEVVQIWQLDTQNNSWITALYHPWLGFQGGSTSMISGYGYVFKLNTLASPPYAWNPYD